MVYFLHSWVSGHIGLWRQKKPCAFRRAIKKVGFRNPAGFHPQVDCFVILPFAIVNNLASAPAALGLVQRRPRERTSTLPNLTKFYRENQEQVKRKTLAGFSWFPVTHDNLKTGKVKVMFSLSITKSKSFRKEFAVTLTKIQNTHTHTSKSCKTYGRRCSP